MSRFDKNSVINTILNKIHHCVDGNNITKTKDALLYVFQQQYLEIDDVKVLGELIHEKTTQLGLNPKGL